VSVLRSPALAWYGGVLGGLLPLLLLGFLYSALADRTVFALWALVAGAIWVAVLRRGLAAGWSRSRLAAALALALAAGLAVFARLEWQHHEILDLGFRAVFPALYQPAATAPATVGALAGAFAVAGVALLPLALRAERSGIHEGNEGDAVRETP
jgi:hypothetical protein